MNTKKLSTLLFMVMTSVTLVACGSDTAKTGGESSEFKVVLVTDVGGVSDKSFNQGAWEGLQAWGKEHGKTENVHYNYLQSNSDSDYATNFGIAVGENYNMIFGTGLKLTDAITESAKANPEHHFTIVDSVIDLPNVASIMFKEQEASFLAGVAAAMTSKTDKVGFIGGMHLEVIDRFEAGFKAGVKAVKPNATVEVQYADSFTDAAKGKALAQAMYANNVDVIYHAAAGVGNGIFTEAKELVKADPSKQVWVIGVDQDQSEEGKIDETRNITLTSAVKGVGAAIKKFSEDAEKGIFHGGETVTFGLAENGVYLTDGQLSDEVKAKVAEYKQQIINGQLTVPTKP